MKTLDKVNAYVQNNPEEARLAVNTVSAVVGTVIGLAIRKKMVDTGMVKSFWLPGLIRKPGTYRKEEN